MTFSDIGKAGFVQAGKANIRHRGGFHEVAAVWGRYLIPLSG
jgi:hypothetical protein